MKVASGGDDYDQPRSECRPLLRYRVRVRSGTSGHTEIIDVNATDPDDAISHVENRLEYFPEAGDVVTGITQIPKA